MIDVFVDLSGFRGADAALRDVIERWMRPEQLGTMARRVTGVLGARSLQGDALPCPRDWSFTESQSALPALSAALDAAGRDRVPLLVLVGAVDANSDATGVMRECLERDPMFGFAVPRIGCANRCCFVRVTPQGGAAHWLPRKILAELPAREILVELAAPCMLIGPQVLGNVGPLDRRFEGVPAALLHYMAGARRCGFRTVLCNRAVVGLDGLACDGVHDVTVQPLPDLSPADGALLHQLVPDIERSWQQYRAGSWELFERNCTAVIGGPAGTRRPSLLLDIRNVVPLFNGTTQAVLGVVNGIRALGPRWEVALLADPAGAAFHDLPRVYAGWTVHTAVPDRAFTATLRPSQPWHIREMVDVHRVSLFNAYLMLDTIAWDIAYLAPHLEGAWQFLADHADALLFDSDFTRQRFVERFPAGRAVPSTVMHFSFDPKEYIRSDLSRPANEGSGGPAHDDDFILVIGNSLDHKDVRYTVEALASAFPFRHIKALGLANPVSPFVTALHSGDFPELEMHRLYASARFVVYPSFYEGFGFPILTALAYGRTVFARRSALLEEVAARCDRRGRLVMFERREELVDLMGRLIHGDPVPEHPLGLGLANGRCRTWHDVGQDTLAFLESIVREPSRSRWIAREHVVQQLVSYRQ